MNNDLANFLGGAGFDPRSVEPQSDFEAIPPGKYIVLIEEAEVKQTKAGNGHYINLRLSVIEGPHKNRKVFDNINIDNPSAQCVEIGLRSLSALGLALGLNAITDTAQLLNRIVTAHIKVKDDQNSVRTYSAAALTTPLGAALPQGPHQTGPQTRTSNESPAPGQQPTALAKPPWAR